MGTVLNIAGNNSAAIKNQSNISVHTDGTLLTAVRDPGVSAATVKVFSSADRGATWTLRSTLTAPADVVGLCTAQFVDGSIGILVRTTTGLIRYNKVTYGTWASSGWETIGTYANVTVMDMDISDSGAVLVAFKADVSPNIVMPIWVRSTAGAWVLQQQLTQGSVGSINPAANDISISVIGVWSGTLNYVIANSTASQYVDVGIEFLICQVTESTGVAVGSALLKGTYHGNKIDPSNIFGTLRRVRIFRTGVNEVTLLSWFKWASASRNVIDVDRFTLTGNAAITLSRSYGWTGTSNDYSQVSNVGFAMNSNRDIILREFRISLPQIAAKVFPWNNTTDSPEVPPPGVDTDLGYADYVFSGQYALCDGPRRNLAQSQMDFIYQIGQNVAGVLTAPVKSATEAAPDRGGVSAITSLSPAAGSIGNTANPNLVAVIDTDAKYSQSAYRLEFQFATDVGFTTNLLTYRQPFSKAFRVDGTDVPGVTVTASDTLPGTYNLTKTTWYYRARLVDAFGEVGLWTASQTFIVGHPPTLVPIAPTGGGLFNWNSGVRTYSWTFTDPSGTDYQTAYEFILKNVNTGVTIFSSGKVVSPDAFITYTIASATHKDAQLSWQVRGYDSDDTVGPWSTLQLFTLTDPTTATIAAPTVDQVLTTGIPTIQFTPSTGGSPTRTIKEYVVSITKAGDTVWAKRVSTPNLASGTPQSVQVEQGYLQNNTGYSVQIQVTDSGNNQGASVIVPFTVAWVPAATPTGVTVDTSSYNIEDQGYNKVIWSDAARDVDFVSWRVERRDDLIDSLGNVLLTGDWQIIAQVYVPTASYEYRDYYAPSSYKVTYRVIQNVNRLGQNIDSLPGEAAPVTPVSDGYWLINPNSGDIDYDAFKMSIVTTDDFTIEQEEAEFTVIGRGRIVNKGQRLGPKGQLVVRLRHTGNTSARQKKLRLEAMQEETRQVYLRNPFGDMFKVNVSAMTISRIAGVGLSEFCDVTIPYAEVSE